MTGSTAYLQEPIPGIIWSLNMYVEGDLSFDQWQYSILLGNTFRCFPRTGLPEASHWCCAPARLSLLFPGSAADRSRCLWHPGIPRDGSAVVSNPGDTLVCQTGMDTPGYHVLCYHQGCWVITGYVSNTDTCNTEVSGVAQCSAAFLVLNH